MLVVYKAVKGVSVIERPSLGTEEMMTVAILGQITRRLPKVKVSSLA